MLILGSHVSFKNDTQLVGSVNEALEYGSDTFMFYTGAPQNTMRGPINDAKTLEALQIMKDEGMKLENVIVHAPYIVNLANNSDEQKYKFAQDFLRTEIDRCMQIGVRKMVLHPGSATTIPHDQALDNIVEALNNILLPSDHITILLETMAGKGTELGRTTDELKYIIDRVDYPEKLGVCLDTCHLNDAGIDIGNFDAYLDDFDKKIGIDRIGCIHINDSKNECGSHKDRHENFGYGTIGFDKLINVIYNPRLDNIPKILETPYVDKIYQPFKFEIDMIRTKKFNPNFYEDVVNYYK